MTITADAPAQTPTDRLVAALADPDHLFTRDQLLYFMATAARWARENALDDPTQLNWKAGYAKGYRDGQAQLEADEAVSVEQHREAVRDAVQFIYERRAADAARPSAYLGGPVREW
jgi:hypothetical protein